MAGQSILKQAAAMNELVKQAEYMAEDAYVTALNAMFFARRSSSQNTAFRAVTGELRHFSRTFKQRMDELRRHIHGIIYMAADYQKNCRRWELIQRSTGEGGPANRRAVNWFNRDKLLQGRGKIVGQINLCRTALGRAMHDCKIGQTLSVLVRVESVYIVDKLGVLQGYAEKLEAGMDRIESRLASLINQSNSEILINEKASMYF